MLKIKPVTTRGQQAQLNLLKFGPGQTPRKVCQNLAKQILESRSYYLQVLTWATSTNHNLSPRNSGLDFKPLCPQSGQWSRHRPPEAGPGSGHAPACPAGPRAPREPPVTAGHVTPTSVTEAEDGASVNSA